METIHWYNFLAAFFAGGFLLNATNFAKKMKE